MMLRTIALLCVAYVAGLVAGMPPAWPFDFAANLGFTPDRKDLRLPMDGKRHVVVLQHGLLRSSAALVRIERTLQRHGYEVHNLDYPSTAGTIAEHADRLARAIAAIDAAGPVAEMAFVGHSMGGLVIEEYLRRPEAHSPSACVYIATPHRGAVLADRRRHWFLFRWVMGDKAASELSTGDPLHQRPIPFAARSGVIVGDIGPGNSSIPGNDDGTVGVDEARLPGAAAELVVPLGHTRIAFDPGTADAVLVFLRTGKFPSSTGDAAAGR